MRFTSFILLLFTTCASIASAAPFVVQRRTFAGNSARDISDSGGFEQEPWEADLPDDSISTRDLNPTQMTGMIVGMIVAGVIVIRAGECLCRYPFRGRRQPDVELGQLQQPTAQAGNVGPPPPYNGPHGPIIIVEVPVGILGRFMNLVRGTRCPAELPPPAYDSRPPNPSNAAHGPSHQHSHNQHTLPEPQGPPPAYNELETRNSKKDMESTELL